MRLTWALLAFLATVTAEDAYAAVALKTCSTPDVGCVGYYRALGFSTSPPGSSFGPPSNVTGISVGAIGVQAAANATTAAARVDVAGWRFKTPMDTSDSNSSLTFYFGYLGVAGVWDNSTRTGAVVGALAEVVSILNSINVWYDNDNVAGFHWDITQPDHTKRWDILDCATGEQKGYDTLDPNGGIDLKTLTWTPIDHKRIQCNTIPALSTAPDTCEIHYLTTSGSTSSTPAVITIVARIATQRVLINGIEHGPDRAKFDVNVQYPWSEKNAQLYSPLKARLALISFAAGKAGAFVGAAVKRDDNSDSLVFAAAGASHMAYYAYKPTATIDGQVGAPVMTQVITGDQIAAFDCTGGAPCGGVLGLGLTAMNFIVAALKWEVAVLQGLTWMSSLAIHSLGTTAVPKNVDWDPEVGSTANVPTSSANFAAPGLLLLLGLFLL